MTRELDLHRKASVARGRPKGRERRDRGLSGSVIFTECRPGPRRCRQDTAEDIEAGGESAAPRRGGGRLELNHSPEQIRPGW